MATGGTYGSDTSLGTRHSSSTDSREGARAGRGVDSGRVNEARARAEGMAAVLEHGNRSGGQVRESGGHVRIAGE